MPISPAVILTKVAMQPDIAEFNQMELFSILQPDNPLLDQKWYRLYVGISRVNEALSIVNALSEEEYPKSRETSGTSFLRGTTISF
jgi:hypothetical protein